MIITPQELKQWMDEGKSFTVVDVRPADQRKESPLAGLKPVIPEADSIPVTENESVLICQFGIVTEGMILEKDLENTFSLLGGAQAWDEFFRKQQDLSRWSRQT
ncbi:MAG: rhodanese-like domain-containing protein, partial [Candidatus Neomarinimicrobiota bacterium]|nr:rhodanese-like domain-containing protein [Candidatus Neomarinimicrobiota bacterium]